jgi:NitT/TauT family transport system substrate-binding protein
MARQRTRALVPLAFLVAAVSLLAACGSDGGSASSDTTPASTPPSTTSSGDAVVAGQPIPAARCEANKAAGKITYLSGFDFAASASIVEVLVAKAKGYFDDLCLDVELSPSFSTTNYPLVASNAAQFSSGGSFSEVLNYGAKNEADFRVLAVEGKTGIDTLIIKDGKAPTIDDLKGTTIGIKGALPSGVKAMLLAHGLVEGKDFQTALLDGFDPVAQMAIPGIVGLPGFKSNEPGQLERAGVKFHTFDPAAEGIPGSFGILYTNAKFLEEHPTAAVDFMRAAMKGLADAIADPDAAAKIAVDQINGHGNPNYLSPEGETFRWNTESKLVTDSTPKGQPVGAVDLPLLQKEVDAYAKVGLFGATVPSVEPVADPSVLQQVYAPDGTVIWPSS